LETWLNSLSNGCFLPAQMASKIAEMLHIFCSSLALLPLYFQYSAKISTAWFVKNVGEIPSTES